MKLRLGIFKPKFGKMGTILAIAVRCFTFNRVGYHVSNSVRKKIEIWVLCATRNPTRSEISMTSIYTERAS